MISHEITLRSAESTDLERLLTFAYDSPGAPQWTRQTWQRVLGSAGSRAQRFILVAESAGEFVGFGVLGLAGDTAELESLAVRTAWRRRGIARRLCHELFAWARTRGISQISLEVRVSNVAAHALYKSLGFQVAGLRRAYYRDPEEDALVMTRALQQSS
ncbi:MAG TPA: ribosomal protein S18-alanine N-acetyltransferase [Acidobacteriaceae bacterium]|jgi:ribosomal-protein-alanine N-acetyltransferase